MIKLQLCLRKRYRMKKLILILCYIFLAACSEPHDEAYYREHPEALKQKIVDCSLMPGNLDCQKLDVIAIEMNKYIYDLQTGPQIFGQSILKLQETIASQKSQLKNEPKNDTLKNNINNNQQSLSERLAIVRWLESPAR